MLAADAKPVQRAFRIDDLFEMEDIGRYFGGPYAFSTDGKKLAFTRVRAKKTLGNFKWEYLWGNAGGDVWLQESPDKDPVNLTNGATDGSGWWSPLWSPDGSKLAMLSTRGGNVFLWVWDANTRKLRQVTTRGIDFNGDIHEVPYLWVDAQHILCAVLPPGEQPVSMKIELQTPQIATAAWPKVTKGVETTVSVLESGVPVNLNDRPQGDLLLVDAGVGPEKVVEHGSARRFQVSPNHQAIAFTQQTAIYLPKAEETLAFGTSTFSGLAVLKLVKLDGTPIALKGDIAKSVVEDSLRWSPDGNELAYFGYANGEDQPPQLYRLNLATQTSAMVTLKNLDVTPPIRQSTQFEWTGANDLFVRAAKKIGDAKIDVATRRDWWLVAKDGSATCLTEKIKTPPKQFWPQSNRQAFVGLADDDLWRVDTVSKEAKNLTESFEPKVSRISWPSMTNEGTDEYRRLGDTYSQVVFSVQDGEVLTPYLLDLASGQITKLEKPAPQANLEAYQPAVSTAIFFATDRNGLHVWRNNLSTKQSFPLVTANTFLKDVAEGEFKSFEYISLNGEKLKGWMILPYGYDPSKTYPMIAWVYAGSVYRDRPPTYFGINSSLSLNLQIPAAHGYVVLLPSMPLAEEGLTEDPMLRLPEGVLPAVDKLVEMKIADPNRLYLMGQSFGGFSTYGLVTQTQKFKAAVSLAGLSNLISLYGTFGARERYTNFPQENLFMQSLSESAQVGMGNPPWKDQGRYIRNSPITYVDRVKTPLMIIQGDMDYVAIQQGEEFFSSLYRQGKRAKFVRYWGEGHVLESPANIRDMWKQIFSWFDTFAPSSVEKK
jgi:dipeptidyl aminopeptidase/acylaminoacyl peptidase